MDELGQATPDMVVPRDDIDLIVHGRGFMGQYTPLSRGNLEQKLLNEYVFINYYEIQKSFSNYFIDSCHSF